MPGHTVPAHVAADRVVLFDIYDDARLKQNLHQDYAALVAGTPDVFYTPLNGGHWVVTRHAVAENVLQDYEHFSAKEMQIPRVEHPHALIPLNLDPPESIPYRRLLMPHFSPKAVAEMEDNVRALAVRLVDAVAAKGECEFYDAISSRFPVTVFMELMGIPFDRFERFRDLAETFFRECGEAPEAQLAIAGQIIGEMMQLVEMKRQQPADDLISRLLAAEIDGRRLSAGELQSITFLLFLAGLDTVTNVMTFTYRALAADPDLQARLREDSSAIPGFVEEALRLFGVVNVPRLVVKDCTRHGVTFKAGDMVLCNNPMVGRDPQLNPDPDKIDPDRKHRTHITFSTGPHLCLGHVLARSELRILTEEWLKRIPSFTVAPGFVPSFRAGMVMSMASLPLQWPVSTAH